MFRCNDCVLKGFLPLHCKPPPAALCISYHHKMSDLNVGHYVQIQGCAGKSVHLGQSCLRENGLRGEVHTVVIPVCLHYVRFKAAVPCLQHCQNYSCCTVSPLKIFSKRVWTTFVNQNRQCVVMMCVHVWVIRCQRWIVAVKWAFCVVRPWAIKCQLFVRLLSGGDLNRCTVKDEWFQTGGKLSRGLGNIICTRRLYIGQWGCRRTVLTCHYWLIRVTTWVLS